MSWLGRNWWKEEDGFSNGLVGLVPVVLVLMLVGSIGIADDNDSEANNVLSSRCW